MLQTATTDARRRAPAPSSDSNLRPDPLSLWHLLSLDAPTVAALWTWFIARSSGVFLPLRSIAAMFLAVWMLYAADRLLDARLLDARPLDAATLEAQTPSPAPELEQRHYFHHRHRRIFLGAIGAAAITLACLLPTLLPAALLLYALLASVLFAWFLLIHTRLATSDRLPKEIAVGLFFPAAVFIPTVARRPDLRLSLLAAALLFAAVCALNCLFLYAWEHPYDRSRSHWTTRFATVHLTPASLAVAGAAICAGIVGLQKSTPNISAPAFACALSVVALLLLNARRNILSPIHLRAAADLTLLSPLALLPLLPALGK